MHGPPSPAPLCSDPAVPTCGKDCTRVLETCFHPIWCLSGMLDPRRLRLHNKKEGWRERGIERGMARMAQLRASNYLIYCAPLAPARSRWEPHVKTSRCNYGGRLADLQLGTWFLFLFFLLIFPRKMETFGNVSYASEASLALHFAFAGTGSRKGREGCC